MLVVSHAPSVLPLQADWPVICPALGLGLALVDVSEIPKIAILLTVVPEPSELHIIPFG
jgi:hypothetical protein